MRHFEHLILRQCVLTSGSSGYLKSQDEKKRKQVGTPRKARVVFQELERFFSLAPQKNFLQVEVSSQE